MYSGSIRTFPSYPVTSSILGRELPKDLCTKDKEKIIKVVSEYFADQKKTKTNIRIESGFLLTALSGTLSKDEVDFNDIGMSIPTERISLNEDAIDKLRGHLLSALLSASSPRN